MPGGERGSVLLSGTAGFRARSSSDGTERERRASTLLAERLVELVVLALEAVHEEL